MYKTSRIFPNQRVEPSIGHPRADSRGARVEISQLDKAYGTRSVLTDLDLTIEPGQFVAIIGRSGCGKTTLLRLLAGLEAVTAGHLTIDGSQAGTQRSGTRIMFQDARLLPWRTVAQNVAIGLKGTPADIQSRVQEVLHQVGLDGRGEDWPKCLSGGQKQRVALARALLHRPRLLLLDEPLGALDALTRLETQRLIEKIWKDHGFTTILVTHDVAEAVVLADRIILLDEGRITMDEAIQIPRSRSQGDPDFARTERLILNQLMSC
jgi:sulfonate transport system ATP-binding protein